MKKIAFRLLCFLIISLIFSCKNSENKTASQTAAQTVTEPSITNDTSKHSLAPQEYSVQATKVAPPNDTLFVDVYANGNIKLGTRNIDMDSLTSNLTDTLKTIKRKTGRLPKVIKSRSNGEVLMGVRGATHDAIDDAKKNVGFPKEKN